MWTKLKIKLHMVRQKLNSGYIFYLWLLNSQTAGEKTATRNKEVWEKKSLQF